MTQEKDQQIIDLQNRLAALEGKVQEPSPSAPPPQGPAPKENGNGCIAGVVACIVLFGVASYCSSQSNDTAVETFEDIPVSNWQPPEGYSQVSGFDGTGGVAAKWDMPTRSECRGSGKTCFAVEFVTEQGCPRNFYVSLTILDSSDNNIGWTNDTAQGVRAGEKVRLIFDTYESGANRARIAEVNCY